MATQCTQQQCGLPQRVIHEPVGLSHGGADASENATE